LITEQRQLERLAGLAPDSHAWADFVIGTLHLPGSYAPAAHRVIGQNRWRHFLRKGQNPLGYIKTATMREAAKLGLAMDRYKSDEPRVSTKDRAHHVALPAPRGVDWASREHCGAAYSDDEQSYEDHLNRLLAKAGEREPEPDPERSIPLWLRLPDGEINWRMVSRNAVLNPRMEADVARVLRLRAQGWSRRRAVKKLSNTQALEAAWKWVDRYHDRIAHVLSLETPPVESTPITPQRRFIPPSHALLKKLSSGLQPEILCAGPSLRSLRYQRWPGVPAEADVSWDGTALRIWHRGSIVTVKATAVEEAARRLSSLHATGELAGVFAFIEKCGRCTSLAF